LVNLLENRYKVMKKIFIGIDFSKKTFDATMSQFIDEETETRLYAKFDNHKKGFKKFFRWAKKGAKDVPYTDWLLCGENTGMYSIPMAEWAYGQGFFIWIENALAIKRSLGLVRGKNDQLDSARIAEYAMEKRKKARRWHPLSESLKSLKTLLLRRDGIDQCRRKLLNIIKEEQAVLGHNETLDWVYDRVRELTDQMKELTEEMKTMMEQKALADPELATNYTIIKSFKGIGVINTTTLLVYTNNFQDVPTANKLATMYGVAPFGEDSGDTIHKEPHVSFYANRWLKAQITNAAKSAVIWNDKIVAYFYRLTETEKKPYGVAMNNVKSKILHIVFTMVKNQQVFDYAYDVKKKDKNEKGKPKVLNLS
jgi:transposase